MKNKGLSTIVATLIAILLVLVAVGIIWVVVRNVIQSGTDQIASNSKCMDVDVRATQVSCAPNTPDDGGNNGVCDVTYSRSAGGSEIGGIKILLYDEGETQNYPHEIEGQIEPLATTTATGITSGLSNVSKVEVSVYFLDSSNNKQYCTPTTYTF